MQEGGDSNPKGANEHGSKQPGPNSERGGVDKSESEIAEKAYDFYHQHFGVALKSGTQDARSIEATRNPYGSLTEVADKYEGNKSDSWHALKNLIRYQSSATPPDEISSYGSAGNTFEAQWFGKTDPSRTTFDLPQQLQPADAVRLKWTPMVDNVAEPVDASTEADAADVEPVHGDAEAVHTNVESVDAHSESVPDLESVNTDVGSELPVVGSGLPNVESVLPNVESVSPNVESVLPNVESVLPNVESVSPNVESVLPNVESVSPNVDSVPADVQSVLPNVQSVQADGESVSATVKHGVEINENVVDLNSKLKSSHYQPAPLKINRPLSPQAYEELLIATARGDQRADTSAPQVEDDEISAQEVAEARSKFGTLNAFERLQKRTKARSETKEEQSITGDMPDPAAATNDPNTEVPESVDSANDPNTQVTDSVDSANDQKTEIPKPTITTIEGAAVINQWCSTSTGDALPSLEELNSIPTPSVMTNPPAQQPHFSLSTPKPTQPTENHEADTAPDSVPQAARASWLKAASEYSASVIKAVTEQMKMLSAKPKKVTPESPEFETAELPDESPDKSDDISAS
jgi:hypothetical protein